MRFPADRSKMCIRDRLYAYKEAGKIQMIREYGQLLSEEYREDGIFVQAKIPAEFFVNVMPRG